MAISIIGSLCAGVTLIASMPWPSVGHLGFLIISWVLLPIGLFLGSGSAGAASVAAFVLSIVGSVLSAIAFVMLILAGILHGAIW